MAIRSRLSQSEHDMVVIASADTYPSTDKVYTNSSGERNYSVDGEYPDVVVLRDHGASEETIIEEIETEDSVNKTERDQQWRKYASLGCTFHLVVPRSMLSIARDLIQGIDVDLLQWYVVQNGQVYFGNDE
jgi:hypothetical protein